jgi:predicted metal-dependent enzyme (double-stranded beta helix superfamily)
LRLEKALTALGGSMFDLDTFIDDCQTAVADPDPRGAMRDLLSRTVTAASGVADVLARDEGGINVLYSAPDLTVLNVIWAPQMAIYPHDHRMWAAIGMYTGAEDNTLYRRGTERIQAAGHRLLEAGDVFGLGPEAIHAVRNPRDRFTGAIHVYGGDFVNAARSQWDPDSLTERPYDIDEVRRRFAAANDEWRAQLGHDLDEAAR